MSGRLLCFLGFHDWRRSRFVALNSRVADFNCARCWKWRDGESEVDQKPGEQVGEES